MANKIIGFINQKYGSLVNIFKDSCITPDDKLLNNLQNTCEIRTFSNNYIIYLKNPCSYPGNYYENGVPHIPFDFGIKYPGNVNDIISMRYLNIEPEEDFSMGYIFIFESTKYIAYRITSDPRYKGLDSFGKFKPLPDYLTRENISKINSFTRDFHQDLIHFDL